MLLSVHNLQPSQYGHCVHEPTGQLHVWLKRTWQLSTKQFILFSIVGEISFWLVFTWNTNIFISLAHICRSSHIPHTQKSLSLIFQVCSSRFLTANQTTGYSSWISVNSHIWPIVFPGKMHSQVHCSKFCTLECFPLPLSIRDVLERGCNAAHAYLQMVYA